MAVGITALAIGSMGPASEAIAAPLLQLWPAQSAVDVRIGLSADDPLPATGVGPVDNAVSDGNRVLSDVIAPPEPRQEAPGGGAPRPGRSPGKKPRAGRRRRPGRLPRRAAGRRPEAFASGPGRPFEASVEGRAARIDLSAAVIGEATYAPIAGHGGVGAHRVVGRRAWPPPRSPGGRSPSEVTRPNLLPPILNVVQGITGALKLALAALIGMLGALALGYWRSRRQLTSAREAAHRDAVTGLPNRAFLDESLRRMAGHAARTDSSLAVVMFDLDHFKAVNDVYGHAKGDEVLASVGAIVREELRAGDAVGRYGGEEFMVLMPDTDEPGARVAAAKLHTAVRRVRVPGIDEPITASFGVAAARGAEELDQLVSTADAALYRAKEDGRDRVTTASDAPRAPLAVA